MSQLVADEHDPPRPQQRYTNLYTDLLTTVREPLLCRLNLRHHWHYVTNPEDRTRSRVCARCGKDDPRLGNAGPVGVG